jgi:16S rRNA processing protein RimM
MAERAPAGWVALGHVVRAHGVHGAVLVEPYTDDPLAVLAHGDRLELLSPDGAERRPAGPLSGRPGARGLIVTFGLAAAREAAEALKGWRLGLDRRFLPPAGDDEVYQADLEGLTVLTPEGRILGRVDGLMEAGAGLILVVLPPGEPGRELLLPFQEEFVVRLAAAGGRLVYDPPEGLLDL